MNEYTVTDKVRGNFYRNTNWTLRVHVHQLRNSGMTFEEIGNELGISYQRANQVWHQIKNKDIEWLKKMADEHK